MNQFYLPFCNIKDMGFIQFLFDSSEFCYLTRAIWPIPVFDVKCRSFHVFRTIHDVDWLLLFLSTNQTPEQKKTSTKSEAEHSYSRNLVRRIKSSENNQNKSTIGRSTMGHRTIFIHYYLLESSKTFRQSLYTQYRDGLFINSAKDTVKNFPWETSWNNAPS